MAITTTETRRADPRPDLRRRRIAATGDLRNRVLVNPFDDRSAQLKTKMATTFAGLAAANIAAWAWAWLAFRTHPVLLGMAALAYIFGLRHAFDADHIAAIDNVVRKLMRDGKRPYSVGLFFALGHSTVVVLACAVVSATVASLQPRLVALREISGTVGAGVSALFLFAIGLANLVTLNEVWRTFRRTRHGQVLDEKDIDAGMTRHGLVTRILRPLLALVSQSWRIYPIGLLFGLGFDTATEIGLLGISASQTAQGLSPWTILVFPALFTAGMSLMDTADSTLMTAVYGWSFITPARKLWYNLTITAASVAVAGLIGSLELLGLFGERFDFRAGPWRGIVHLNTSLGGLGYLTVGVFIAGWISSIGIQRARQDRNQRLRQTW
jgi:high-affinity nickel-transport protein